MKYRTCLPMLLLHIGLPGLQCWWADRRAQKTPDLRPAGSSVAAWGLGGGGGGNPPPPKLAADLADLFCRFVGFLNLPICSANSLGFCDFADLFCPLVGASGILGHLIWRCHSKMCIIYWTLDTG